MIDLFKIFLLLNIVPYSSGATTQIEVLVQGWKQKSTQIIFIFDEIKQHAWNCNSTMFCSQDI